MTQIDLTQLTELQNIHKKLSSGYHISEQDVGLWQQLDQHIDAYQALFSALGHDLRHDSRGFYYLFSDESTPTMGKTSRGIALTIFVLIEQFANQGKDPVRTLFDESIDLAFMQQVVQQYKHLFEQLDILSGSDLRKDVYKRMVRLGLAKEEPQGFRHLAPLYRYLDALMDIQDPSEVD